MRKRLAARVRSKLAAITTTLNPHQQRVVDRLQDPEQRGLIAVHGLGSGKTLTSLAVRDALGVPASVVVPAALQDNYRKEIQKHTDTPPPIDIQSLELAAREGGPRDKRPPLLIVDEAHRIRNPGKTRQALLKSQADKRLALTGSLVYNHPSDVAGPINFAAGESLLPLDKYEFTERYLRQRYQRPGILGSLVGKPGQTVTELNPRNKRELQKILQKYVDYHPGSTEGFPVREDQTIEVPMTKAQRKLYDQVLADAPPWVRNKVMKNLPPTKTEAKQLNAFLAGVRQVSNTTAGHDTVLRDAPKIDKAVEEMRRVLDENPRAKAVIYSNYIDAGLNPYKERLEAQGVSYGEFSGRMKRKEREQLVRDYNNDKIRALLLSSAGGEGLDLKGTSLIQVLEPHWNEERAKQVIGRGIRFGSHNHLPEEERKVLVQRFLATRPRVGISEKLRLKDPGFASDQYLTELGRDKEEMNNLVRRLYEREKNRHVQ